MTTYSAQVAVTLNMPVAGQTASTVYVPERITFRPGAVVRVLVDPARPAYAELPGVRDVKAGRPVVPTVIGLLLCLTGCVLGVLRVRMLWRRRVSAKSLLPQSQN